MLKKTSVSEFKAKLAHYLRCVKGGDELEIEERGKPVAVVYSAKRNLNEWIIPPQKDPKGLSQMKFSVKPAKSFDAAHELIEERRER